MKPLDYFEEIPKYNDYETHKTFLFFILSSLYGIVPIIVEPAAYALNSDISFITIVVLILVLPFAMINLFFSTLIYLILKALCWVISSILNTFQNDTLAKLFKRLSLKLDIIVISVLFSLFFLMDALRPHFIHFLVS